MPFDLLNRLYLEHFVSALCLLIVSVEFSHRFVHCYFNVLIMGVAGSICKSEDSFVFVFIASLMIILTVIYLIMRVLSLFHTSTSYWCLYYLVHTRFFLAVIHSVLVCVSLFAAMRFGYETQLGLHKRVGPNDILRLFDKFKKFRKRLRSLMH